MRIEGPGRRRFERGHHRARRGGNWPGRQLALREVIAERTMLGRVRGELDQLAVAVQVLLDPRRTVVSKPRRRVQTRADDRDRRVQRDQQGGQE